MCPLGEREQALNLYFHEGMGYKGIAKTKGIPLETVKSWCRRYRLANGIPKRGKVPLSKEPVSKETIYYKAARHKRQHKVRKCFVSQNA
jgi:transposase